MTVGTHSIAARVDALYHESTIDPDFRAMVDAFGTSTDEELAELIELDGRARLVRGRVIDLQRYLSSIPGLQSYELALDAAIDVTLRHLSGGASPSTEAVRALCSAYPQLSAAIEDAALLAAAVVSTTGISRIIRPAPRRQVPCDFGPIIESGAPRYRLTRQLGMGSAGDVYLAEDRRLSDSDKPALVAIKLLNSRAAGTRSRHLFIEEASKARRVNHENVVRVLDRGVSDGDEDYIVYEHIDSGTVEEWFEKRGRAISPREAASLVMHIAMGLQAAHAAGLVHCDLKPSNILVTSGGVPKVADFGISVRESEVERLADGRPLGNIAFISPEQYRGEPGSLSVASDIYALGGILYFLLTARLPNGSTAGEIAATHDRTRGRPNAPSLDRPDVDADLSAICRRAMAVAPSERHASAAAVADDLRAWLDGQPILWLRPSLWKMTRLAAKRRPIGAVGAGLVLVSLVGGTAAGGYWAAEAGKAEQDATKLRRDMSTARRELGNAIETLKRMNGNRLDQDLIPMTVALESIAGSPVLGSPEARERLWKERIATAQWIVSEYTSAGRATDVETLLWEATLGFWLLNEGKVNEAEQVLVPCSSKWAQTPMRDDPLAVQVARLAASATVRRLASVAATRPLNEQERASLVAAEPVLWSGATQGLVGGFPTRLHSLTALVPLYEPALLDNPDKLRDARQRLQRFLDNSKKKFVAPPAKPGAAGAASR